MTYEHKTLRCSETDKIYGPVLNAVMKYSLNQPQTVYTIDKATTSNIRLKFIVIYKAIP